MWVRDSTTMHCNSAMVYVNVMNVEAHSNLNFCTSHMFNGQFSIAYMHGLAKNKPLRPRAPGPLRGGLEMSAIYYTGIWTPDSILHSWHSSQSQNLPFLSHNNNIGSWFFQSRQADIHISYILCNGCIIHPPSPSAGCRQGRLLYDLFSLAFCDMLNYVTIVPLCSSNDLVLFRVFPYFLGNDTQTQSAFVLWG